MLDWRRRVGLRALLLFVAVAWPARASADCSPTDEERPVAQRSRQYQVAVVGGADITHSKVVQHDLGQKFASLRSRLHLAAPFIVGAEARFGSLFEYRGSSTYLEGTFGIHYTNEVDNYVEGAPGHAASLPQYGFQSVSVLANCDGKYRKRILRTHALGLHPVLHRLSLETLGDPTMTSATSTFSGGLVSYTWRWFVPCGEAGGDAGRLCGDYDPQFRVNPMDAHANDGNLMTNNRSLEVALRAGYIGGTGSVAEMRLTFAAFGIWMGFDAGATRDSGVTRPKFALWLGLGRSALR